MEEPVREVARLSNFDIGIEDHGCPFTFGDFDYGGSGQGFGVIPDLEFFMRLMAVFGVRQLHKVNGKAAWVTHTYTNILCVEPLIPGEGEPFDVVEWSTRAKARSQAMRDAGLHPWREPDAAP